MAGHIGLHCVSSSFFLHRRHCSVDRSQVDIVLISNMYLLHLIYIVDNVDDVNYDVNVNVDKNRVDNVLYHTIIQSR